MRAFVFLAINFIYIVIEIMLVLTVCDLLNAYKLNLYSVDGLTIVLIFSKLLIYSLAVLFLGRIAVLLGGAE